MFICLYLLPGGPYNQKNHKKRCFFEPEVIYRNVEEHIRLLKPDNYPDYLTIVSNGEPTLDINLGKTIKLLKRTGIPVAVITNASLIIYDSVKEDLYQADWVSVKSDASDNDVWQTINRPDSQLDFDTHLKNIFLFAAEYKGDLHTETMIIDGLNDSTDHLEKVADIVKKIQPLKAYLSVPIRPPSEKKVLAPDPEKLNIAWQIFDSRKIQTELLTGFEGTETGSTGNIYEDILNITAVHPLREDTLMKLLEKDNADFSIVESLIKQKLIKSSVYKGKKFYLREYHITRNKVRGR